MHPLVKKALAAYPKGIRVQLGCGDTPLKVNDGWVGIDIQKIPGVIQHDLEERPWPLPDACAVMLVAGCVLPHINPAKLGVVKFMNEAWRVLKVDAQFMISVPYGCNMVWASDPGHCCAFTENSFFYFDPLHASNCYAAYRPLPWKLEVATFQVDGMMEIGMKKRRIDKSYKVAEEWL